MNFKDETNRLIMLIDAANVQATMLKDRPELYQRVKQRFNLFFAQGRTLSKDLNKVIGKDERTLEQYENESAFLLEAIRTLADILDKLTALALLKEFKNGNVKIE